MSKIFISYRRDDAAGYAGWLHEKLSEAFGCENVFMDIDSIDPGLDFVEVLQNAVGSCDVLIALIGRSWVNMVDARGQRRLDDPSDWVRVEIAAALDRGVRVIPTLLHGAAMPKPQELPENLQRLARRNAIELHDARFEYDAGRLIETLRQTIAETGTATEAGRRAEGRSSHGQRAANEDAQRVSATGDAPGGGVPGLLHWLARYRLPALIGLAVAIALAGFGVTRLTNHSSNTILLRDNFKNPAVAQLPTASQDPHMYASGYAHGDYYIRVVDPTQVYPSEVFLNSIGPQTDTSIRVDARVVGSTDGRYVLLGCRDTKLGNDVGEYRFVFSPGNDLAYLARTSAKNGPTTLASGQPQGIHPGNAWNQLELDCVGNTISARINGRPVLSAHDSVYKSGYLWMGVENGKHGKGDSMEGRFANLEVLQS